MNTYVH